jgi:hypothetical protein
MKDNIRKCVTVVFELTEISDLTSLYKAFSENQYWFGSKITAMSNEDEISKVEYLEEILDDEQIDYEEFEGGRV